MNFDWDEEKNASNIRKHGLDFADAWEVFDSYILRKRAQGDFGEERFLGFGALDEHIVAVVFTMRGDTIRVISLRKAKRDERREYKQAIADRLGEARRDG